jgi:hypothetical protein
VRNGEAAVDGPTRAGLSFPQSFHLALLNLTAVDLLDGVLDLTCKDSTHQRYVDDNEPTHNRSVVVPALPKLSPCRGDSLHRAT